MVFIEFIEHMFQFLEEDVLHIINFILYCAKSGGRSVGIVCLPTQATKFRFFLVVPNLISLFHRLSRLSKESIEV
jgi:hypothetical protein